MTTVKIVGAGAQILRAGTCTYHWTGAVVDVDDDTALRLVDQGVAILSDELPAETKPFVADAAIEPDDHQPPVDQDAHGLAGKTVQELRAYAKREGIKVPATVTTRDALLAHLQGDHGSVAE